MTRLGFLAILFCLHASLSVAGEPSPPPLFAVSVNDKHGLVDRDGRVVVPIEYPEAVIYKDGLARVAKGSKVAYLDAKGEFVIRPQDAAWEPFSEGLTPARGKNAKGEWLLGYIDRSGQFTIPPQFTEAKPFSEGMAEVGLPNEWGEVSYGYIDKSGKLVVPTQFDKSRPFRAGLGRVEKKNGPVRVFDKTGKDVTPAGIDFIGPEADGYYTIKKGALFGFMDGTARS